MGSCHRLGVGAPRRAAGVYWRAARNERDQAFEGWNDRAFSEAARVTDDACGERHPTG